MTVRVFRTAAEAGRAVADLIAQRLKERPHIVLGLATGRTALPVYAELVRLHAAGQTDFSRARTFNLDELIGLGPNDPRSFCAFMQRHLFHRVNLRAEYTHVLDGTANDLEAECARFDRQIAATGGLDLQLLGIGGNGHVGFNEPGKWLHARTHRARLTLETRRANASLFAGRVAAVPREALSMGMATILQARSIVLIATGSAKAKAVQSMLSGRIATSSPASFLQLHREAQVVLDVAAASRLKGASDRLEKLP